MIKAILFDFDYTLVDSSEGIVHCFITATNKLGLDAKGAMAIKKTIGMPLKDMFETLYRDNRDLSEIFVTYYAQEADVSATQMTYFYDDAKDMLITLKSKGYKIGIVSTKYRSRIQETLIAYDMNAYFDIVVGGEDVAAHKPSPEGIIKAMESLNCGCEEAIYVGDSVYDFNAAQNATIKFIAVLNGETMETCFRELGQSVDYIAKNLSEVLKIIQKYSK